MLRFIVLIFSLFFLFSFPLIASAEDLILDQTKIIKEEALSFLNDPLNTGSAKRLNSCPMASKSNEDIYQRLNKIYSSLKYSSCDVNNASLMQSFGNLVKYLDTNGGKAETYAGQMKLHQAQAAMDVLSVISANQNCALDIRSKGIIPLISDIVMGISQVSLVGVAASPMNMLNSSVMAAAAGGMVLSSALKIIYNIFKSRFNWDLYEERQQFLELVCAFYTIRMELEDMRFFRIKNNRDEVLFAKASHLKKGLEDQIKNLSEAQEQDVSVLAGGKENVLLLKEMDSIIKMLSLPSTSSSEMEIMLLKANFRKSVPKALDKIKILLTKLNLKNEDFPLLDIDSDKEFLLKNNLMQELKGKSELEISQLLLKPLLEIKTVLNDVYAQALLTSQSSSSYSKEIEDLLILKDKMDLEIKVFSKIIEKKNYISSDEGSSVRQAIIGSFNSSMEIINGSEGWNFFRYTNKQAMEAMNNFLFHYRRFQEFYDRVSLSANYAEKNKNTLAPAVIRNRLEIACSSINQMLRDFMNTESLLNIESDFLDTNKDLFNGGANLYSSFLGIPYKIAPYSKLLIQNISLLEQRERMKQYDYQNEIFNYINSNNLSSLSWHFGDLAVGTVIDILEKNRPRALSLQEFFESNFCNNFIYEIVPAAR